MNRRIFSILVLVGSATLSSAGCDRREVRIARCTKGEQVTCACANGEVGLQSCDASGVLGTCSCEPPAGCPPGITVSCVCTDGDPGTQLCNAGGTFDACRCAPPACVENEIAACACPNGWSGTQLCARNRTFGACDCRSQEASHPPVLGVLDFPDPSPSTQAHVNHGRFWATGANLGRRFHWDAWVAPRTSGYLVSDGFGPAHALRWGPVLQNGQMVFQGEFFTSAGAVKFAAVEGPAPGEWGHHAIDLVEDATILPPAVFLYWNGICVGMSTFKAADRLAAVVGPDGQVVGDGTLYVMGPPSGTMGGRIAAVRAFEQFSPFATGLPLAAFLPERTLGAWMGYVAADFLADYSRPMNSIPDISPSGYSGGNPAAAPVFHPGTVENALPSTPAATLPHWVADPESPYGTVGPLPPNAHETIPSADPPPADALIFDSFGRRSQTFVWQDVPTLGSTEAGSLGAQAWTIGTVGPAQVPAPFGILNGRAVFLERQVGVAWVNAGTSDQDIRLDRFHAGSGHGTTGIAFRVVDAKNWGYVFADQSTALSPEQNGQILLGRIVDGAQRADKILTVTTDNWVRLRVVASATTVTVYLDDGKGGWVTVGSLAGQTAAPNATGAGLAGAPSYLTASSLWRGDNFTVCTPDGC